VAAKSTKQEISASQRRLLTDILNITWKTKEPVDAPGYIGAHPDAHDDLIWLGTRTMVAHDKDLFRVTFFGVAAIRSPIARLLLKRADALATLLRTRYIDRTTRQAQLTVREIATLFGTSLEECMLTLAHLDDALNQWAPDKSGELSTPVRT
jgi:hypothetical protein